MGIHKLRQYALVLILAGTGLLWHLIKRLRHKRQRRRLQYHLQSIADRKRRQISAELDVTAKYGAADESVCDHTAVEISRQVKSGRIPAKEVILACIQRLRTSGRYLNAVAGVQADSAVATALQLDAQKKRSGLLCGVPISVKDQVAVGGSAVCFGIAAQAYNIVSNDAPLIRALRKAGAIPVVKSAQSFGARAADTLNNITGHTSHPNFPGRSSGGSSGGDSALVGSKCVPIGIGTDLLCSLRLPADFCGLCSFKATSERMPISRKGRCGFPGNKSVIGPIARTVEDCVLVIKAAFAPAAFRQNPAQPCLPWNDGRFLSETRLRAGYVCTSNDVHSLLTCNRTAVAVAVDALQLKGHTIVKFEPPPLYDMLVSILQLTLSLNSGKAKGERMPSPNPFGTLQKARRIPFWLKPVLSYLLDRLGRRSDSFNLLLKSTTVNSATGYIQAYQRCMKFRKEFLQRWKAAGLDAVIWPTPCPAYRKGTYQQMWHTMADYAVFNVLDFPVTSVPVTTVSPNQASYAGTDSGMVRRVMARLCEDSTGLPVGVQVAALPFQDEISLRLAAELETALRSP